MSLMQDGVFEIQMVDQTGERQASKGKSARESLDFRKMNKPA
jgi:hypothetical protein